MRFFSCLVLSLPLGKCPVENEAGGASSTGKVMGLIRRRMEPDLVRLDHP